MEHNGSPSVFFASPGNPKGSFHQHSEGRRQKSLQRRFVKAFTQGADCLITLALWGCWSFPKKGMEEWRWDDIFCPRSHEACLHFLNSSSCPCSTFLTEMVPLGSKQLLKAVQIWRPTEYIQGNQYQEACSPSSRPNSGAVITALPPVRSVGAWTDTVSRGRADFLHKLESDLDSDLLHLPTPWRKGTIEYTLYRKWSRLFPHVSIPVCSRIRQFFLLTSQPPASDLVSCFA